MASTRVFGVSGEFPLADLGFFPGFNDLVQFSHFQPPGKHFYVWKDAIPQLPDTEKESSLAHLFNLDKSEFIHYDQEKRNEKPGADDAERVAKERAEAERINYKKNELQVLMDRNDSLRKLQEELTRSIEMTRDCYLKCILSGKVSFSSG